MRKFKANSFQQAETSNNQMESRLLHLIKSYRLLSYMLTWGSITLKSFKNQKGFILYEGLMAIFMLTIITATFFPLFISIQQERVSIREQREAIILLNDFILSNYQDSDLSQPQLVQGEQTIYNLTVEKKQDFLANYCLSWKGRNTRDQSWCLSVYR